MSKVSLWRTHPTLYRQVMLIAVLNILLGINFHIFVPTFLVWNQSNRLWGTAFILIGLAEILSLHVWRNLRAVRAAMGVCVAYTLYFGIGTMQPVTEGSGSAQLPLLYGGLVIGKLLLLLEPYINRWTGKWK